MKNYGLTILVVLFSSLIMQAQHLNGAWKLIEENGKKVDEEVIKIYSNAYFTFASYDKETGEFFEAGAGTYHFFLDDYHENYEIHSKNPKMSDAKLPYDVEWDSEKLILTSKVGPVKHQIWKRIDTANNHKMATSWRIHLKKDEVDKDFRLIEYAPRKTLKMLSDNYYQVIALNNETGQFVGSSGGKWDRNKKEYNEHIRFFSKDQNNVGRSLKFSIKFEDGMWFHEGMQTDGDRMRERWIRYK
ncbi:MAG: hypothetical protein ACQESK_07275 [Bacteroidota bacterium]